MELRDKLSVSSTWKESTDLKSILYLSSKSATVLEGPEEPQCLTLSRPAVGEDCFIRISSLKRLSGYMAAGVELRSGSRTVEVYGGRGEEYLGTSRGTLAEDQEGKERVYCCCVQLSMEEPCYYDQLSLKLLSLQGQPLVSVKSLSVILLQDHSGHVTMAEEDRVLRHTPVDIQSLTSSLHIPTDAPPFIHSLVSTLQHWQAPSDPQEPPKPMDISQMLSALRQMKEVPSSTTTTSEDHIGNGHTHSPEDSEVLAVSEDQNDINDSKTEVGVTLSMVETLIDQKLSALEERLLTYIDKKLAEIMSLDKRNSEMDL